MSKIDARDSQCENCRKFSHCNNNDLVCITKFQQLKSTLDEIDKILQELKPHKNRNAKFVCVMTLLDKDGNVLHVSRGECLGKIAKSQSGTNGFGFDPVFEVDGYDITMADMSEEEKNKISHRGKALTDMLNFIQNNFTWTLQILEIVKLSC